MSGYECDKVAMMCRHPSMSVIGCAVDDGRPRRQCERPVACLSLPRTVSAFHTTSLVSYVYSVSN